MNINMKSFLLIASSVIVLSVVPLYEVYSTTDEDEEQSEEGEDANGSEDGSGDGSGEGSITVNIDPASSDSLTVLSHRMSTDEILDKPTMDINGEIQNNDTESLDFVKVTATFYDAANSILGSDFTYTEPTTLEPGQTAPFKLSAGFGDNLPVDDIASVKLHISGR